MASTSIADPGIEDAQPEDVQPMEPGLPRPRDRATARRRLFTLAALALVAAVALGARLLAHDVVITSDEDNWMRRAGGFTYGLVNGQLGRTYQNGHPGVTAMWVATLTLGPERMLEYADRVHGRRLVGQVPGFWPALVDARVGFAIVTAGLVGLITALSWRLFGAGIGLLTGLVVGLEPFYLGISQLVHMDAILSGCMVASVLAALVRWGAGGGRGWLALSGALGGLALLSKVPAVFLLLFVPVLGWVLQWSTTFRRLAGREVGPHPTQSDVRNPHPALSQGERVREPSPPGRGLGEGRSPRRSSGSATQFALDLLVWGTALLVTFVALWPAVWTLGPVEVLGRVATFARETGGQPHEQGTFFWGEPRADPGPLFYPVALAFRLAPITTLGLVALVVLWRHVPSAQRRTALGLAAYCLGFLLMMTLGAKKFDRYVLPMLPALGVLASLGLWTAIRMVEARPGAPRGVRVALAALIMMLAAWPAASSYPYYLTYYNPLLGGGAAAQRAVMVGNGEGLDQVASWLNDRPSAADDWVVSHSFDILQPLIAASGEPLRDRVPSNADYVVLYRFQMQIGHSPRVVAEYLAREPEHVVTIGGIDYARIYRGPKR